MSERDSGPRDRAAEGSDESFLERWSRRKQAALRPEPETVEEPPDEDAPELEAQAAGESAEADAEVGEPEPEPPGDEDMPPLESIDQGGSVAAFFSPRVSAGLRRAALRRLFAQPEINALEALDDYAEDFSKYKPLGGIITADMRYRAELAARRLAEKLGESLADGEGADARVALNDEPAAPVDDAEPSAGHEPGRTASAAGKTTDETGPSAADTDDKDDENDERRPA